MERRLYMILMIIADKKISKNYNNLRYQHSALKYFLLISFIATPSFLFAQKGKQIELKKADFGQFDKKIGNGAMRLIGNVQLAQGNVSMFCDSAYKYQNNTLEAFGRVHIQQGDSLNMYGDFLKYDGNTKKAELQKNVFLTDNQLTLTTDIISFDVKTSIASYFTGGTIVNKENTLTSQIGYYNSNKKEFSFRKNVVLKNPQYVMNSDTLRYNTLTKTSYFLGPSTISSSQNFIYCENGWYNTSSDASQFSKNAYIINKNQKLYGDSLYYNRKTGYGKAVRNVHLLDTAQNINISGNLAEYFEKIDKSVITQNTLLTQKIENDTLFLHADTLMSVIESEKNDTLQYRIFKGFHKVKFFKSDIQGKCDSLAYSYKDSTMRMFYKPIIWSDKNQLTAERIDFNTSKKGINYIDLINTAFVVNQEDSSKYNQVRGKKMRGYFLENKLSKIKIEGNGQTIYYAKENEELIGVNKVDCSDIMIRLKDSKIDRITFLTKPDGAIYPLNEFQDKELRLKDFSWRNSEKPISKKDIFK